MLCFCKGFLLIKIPGLDSCSVCQFPFSRHLFLLLSTAAGVLIWYFFVIIAICFHMSFLLGYRIFRSGGWLKVLWTRLTLTQPVLWIRISELFVIADPDLELHGMTEVLGHRQNCIFDLLYLKLFGQQCCFSCRKARFIPTFFVVEKLL